MAVAGAVVACESRSLDWLTIADDAGNVWRYVKRGLAQTVAGVHVTWWYDELLTVRPRLVRGVDGRALLRQEGPGLPDTIVVNYVHERTAVPRAQPAGWERPYEYQRE
jgi:hypothetical protein